MLGAGRPLLLIHGGAEDATMLTPQAKALAARGFQVVWYDRRGTGRNRQAGWPRDRGDQHADDAAALIRRLGLAPATVVGFSSGGVVALALAAHHPHLLRQAVAWEPAALGMLPDGDEVHAAIMKPVEAHLVERPDDWRGAWATALTVLSNGTVDFDAPVVQQMLGNAEAAIRDDARLLTRRRFHPDELPANLVTIAVSETPDPMHLAIAQRISGLVNRPLTVVRGAADHEVYLSQPEILAAWLGL
jgi:pimeloyl-ACP methyl ester carboxylesterase